ncbi:unnamed protein product, partial [Laminaria digitata]
MANDSGDEDNDRAGGLGVGQVETENELSGKEVDLFYRSPNGYIHNNANGNGVNGNNGDHRARNGFGGGGRGGPGGAGMGMGQPPGVHGEGVLAPERTSYVFCPEAHGMMSGGMIQRANQAMYDHHHPGARPFSSAGGTGGGTGALTSGGHTRTLGLGRGRGVGLAVGEERIAFKGGNEVKVNVVDSHRNLRQLRLPRGGDGDGDDDNDNLDATSSLAIVSSRSNSGGGGGNIGSNSNSGFFFDASVIGEGGERA